MCFVGSWFPTLVGTSVQLRHSCCRWSFVTRRRLVQKTSHSRWMAVQQLVQYIIIRKDLIRDLGWPLGSVCPSRRFLCVFDRRWDIFVFR
jgi:hypothetical protein